MGDSTSKKVLDSALKALLKGLELSPWVKVPVTFVAELSSRFLSLPDPDKQAIANANQEDLGVALNDAGNAASCDQPDQLSVAIQKAASRGTLLDYLYGMASPGVDELVNRVDGASDNVTKDAPVRRKVAELVEWVESTEGPGLERLRGLLPENFQTARR